VTLECFAVDIHVRHVFAWLAFSFLSGFGFGTIDNDGTFSKDGKFHRDGKSGGGLCMTFKNKPVQHPQCSRLLSVWFII
jgi:hypothetical protein